VIEDTHMRTVNRDVEVKPIAPRCPECGGPTVERISRFRRHPVRVCLASWRSTEPGTTRLACGAPHWSSRS
jgi:transposase